MHVPDGFLSPQVTLPAYAACVPLWAWGARRLGPTAVESLPAMGTLTAVAFVIQTIMVPAPGGTSIHVAGTTLLALRFGPLAAFVCESLVLAVQALLLGVGGVTVLAVNALAIGLIGPLAGWASFRVLRRAGERAAAAIAAYLAMQVSSAAVALCLGLQHALSDAYFPVPFPVTLAATMIPSLTLAGVLEAAYTVSALSLLRRADVRGLA